MSWTRRAAACLFFSILVLVPAHGEAQKPGDIAALNQKAVQLKAQGKYKEAVAAAGKAVALAERRLGADHPDTLKSINNLASLYEAQGRYGEAEPLLKRAVSGFERALGNTDPATLSSVASLASLYESQGRYGEAEPLFKRALEGFEKTRGKDDLQTLISADNLGSLYRMEGRYPEAEPLYKQALAGFERVFGPEHPDTLISVSNMAQLYSAEGRYAEAEPLCKRALQARERLLGPDNPRTLKSLIALANNYRAQGRYREAEPLFRRALDASERVMGADNPDTLERVGSLASIIKDQGHYSEAEPLYKRAMAESERVLGKEHPSTITSINNLAGVYQAQGRYAEAEPLYKRALSSYEHVLGPDHPHTLTGVGNLAALYEAQSRYGEAEPLYKRALQAHERLLGPEHPDTLTSVSNLAALYEAEGRHGEAEALYKRAIEAREKVLGPEHPDTVTSVNNLALLYKDQGRYEEAEPLYKRALAVNERVLGPEHPSTLNTANNLAALYHAQGHYSEAERLYKRTLAAQERVLGPEHPQTLFVVGNLATLYSEQGRYGEAEPFQRRALEARERVLGPDHPETLLSVANLAALHFKQNDWPTAVELWRRSTASIAARTLLGAQDVGQALTGKAKGAAEQAAFQFWALVKTAYRLTPQGGMPEADLAREMFKTAQWVQSSEAAQSLAQMAARGAKGDPKLAALARERQDLVAEWQKRDSLQNAALSQAPDKRDAKAEAENVARLAAIDTQIKEIDKDLSANFPDYAELLSPAPISVEEVQALLGDDEALVLFLDTRGLGSAPEESFIWVVTKTASRWVRSALGTEALAKEVQALRCGLDEAAWEGPRCEQLTGQHYTDADRTAGKPLPFDHARAHRLYQSLFGQVEDLIKDKQLLIVPSGALTQLPFQVLVTAPPAEGDDRSAAWLIRNHAITVLPAASSLKALRRVARPSAAAKPMIGFGNPLLDGPDGTYAELARQARDNKTCSAISKVQVASAAEAEAEARGVAPIQTRGGFADGAFLRQQVPLPETADELCAVARDVNADAGDIYLGARATESEVKRLSGTGQLAEYRIVHFATHGALAGQITGNTEPGLLLTPPSTPSAEDDGYLTASEIAALKLNADWVILSACNTAAGGAQDAEALSGLARAFIYAQARALLVSHWAVNSNATVKLITGAISRLAADKTLGRAEAMRQSMLALIDKGDPQESHPAYWAPFVVVGEGGTP